MSSLSSQDLIQLPRLGAAEAAALIAEMLVLARTQPDLPAPIDRSLRRLAAAGDALQAAIRQGAAPPDPAAARRAARALDDAWDATFDWLSGWCKLASEAHPHREAARALFLLLFPEVLAGSRPHDKLDPAEARARLDALDRAGHEATFQALGGAPFLAELRRTLASRHLAQPGGVQARAALAAAASALRQYVARVASHADPDVEGSDALCAALLRPLQRFHLLNPLRAPEHEYGPVEDTQY